MCQRGFTLIELIVIMLIIGCLIAIAALDFRTWIIKSQIESQVRTMHADLTSARVSAMNNKRVHNVTFSGKQYRIDDDTPALVTTMALKYPITFPGGATVTFDTRGVATDAVPDRAICVNSTVRASYDSIVISQTKINIGQTITIGGACDVANIQIKE